MYNLRSKTKEGEYSPNQMSYHYSSGDMPDKQVKVMLNRLSILETPSNRDSVFQVQDGKIMIKRYEGKGYNVKNILYATFITLLITVIFAMYIKDGYNTYGCHLTRGFNSLPKRLRNLNPILIKAINMKWNWPIGLIKSGFMMKNKRKQKVKKKSGVCYYDIRDFINEIWFKVKEVKNFKEIQTLSFIEEQCRFQNFVPKVADYAQYSFNETYTSFDVNSIIDYASYERGSRILSTSGAEPYVEHKIQSGILQYLLGIKHFNIDELPICWISATLCRYFVSGPSSLLQPWNKPGQCWSFKGSRARVQIQLSERIYITAVSMEHLPVAFAPPANISSAPAQFSIIGLDDFGGDKFTSRSHLGTYRYVLSEPNIQTFTLSEEASSHPYKIIELNIESNHGNEHYTCVYRFRVHGRPITSVQN